MPGFESDIGSKRFAGSGLREFSVSDESFDEFNQENEMSEREVSQVEKEIRLAKEARKIGKERLSDGAKKRIDFLIGMTRLVKNVDLNGTMFVLQTLKSKEMREAIFEASKYDGTSQGPYELRKQLIARSLIQIADVSIEQFIGSNTFQSKLDFIDEMGDIFLNRLYSEYMILADEAIEKFSVKNNEDVNEVMQDLKK